jgi:hypothetical protein
MSAKPFFPKAIGLLIAITFALALGASGGRPAISSAQGGKVQPDEPFDSGLLNPDPAAALTAPSSKLSEAESKEMEEALWKLRRDTAANVSSRPALDAPPILYADPLTGKSSDPESAAESSVLGGEAKSTADPQLSGAITPQVHGDPAAFIIGRNNPNTRANLAGNSTLAEPAGVNEGPHVFYAGNFSHAEYSINGGAAWINVPVPGGQAEAPIACCDHDIIYDQARGLTLWSVFYLNAARTNGQVRIFVRRTIPGGNVCSYTIDPGGAANNLKPDYPHLGLTNDYLYLGVNNTGAGTHSAQVYRLGLDQMYDCVATPTSVFTYPWTFGQRILTPVAGARECMYFGFHKASNVLRIFRWCEDNSFTTFDRTINNTTFGDEDCRGGVGNNDWWDAQMSHIVGFNLRGAVGAGKLSFYWNANSAGGITQGHIRGAIFRESDLALLAQPVIFNNNYCFGNPVISANERGDIGMVLAFGGRAGGGAGTNAAQPAVGLDDDFCPGLGVFCAGGGANFSPVAAGTHNRADARYGDYFTIHPHEPCDNFFGATAYALNGGTGVANVNARWVEFGRNRDGKCYFGWRNDVRVP